MTEEIHGLNYETRPFDWDLKITKDEIPDPQNYHKPSCPPSGLVPIQKVGINKLDFPLNVKLRDGGCTKVMGDVSAYVSLDGVNSRGINMSRLARCFYDKLEGKDDGVDLLDFVDIVKSYKEKLPSDNGYLKVKFSIPLKKQALRENHFGWIKYDCELEITDTVGAGLECFLTVTYNYSSSCPCSYSLSVYSREVLNTPSISHSQPSSAKVKIKFNPNDIVWIEDVIDMCRRAQPSERLPGVVTRVGEFSYAQLMASEVDGGEGSVIGFVEDVARRFYAVLNENPKVLDFSVGICHFESLNLNNAVAAIFKGVPNGLR
jgi:GTP cyclohydrolase I